MDPDLEKLNPKPKDSRYKIESRKIIHQNPWYRYMYDKGQRDDGEKFEYYYIQRNFSSGVIGRIDNDIIMVKQYRYLANKDTLEIPTGGSKGDKETPEECAVREFEEETGYKAEGIIKIGEFDVANGYSSETAMIFLANNCKKFQNQKLDPTEKGLEVRLYSIDKVYEMVQTGEIADSFTLSAFMLAWPHLL